VCNYYICFFFSGNRIRKNPKNLSFKNVNADKQSVTETAEFVADLPEKKPMVNILPYHNITANKYHKLGSDYTEFNMAEPSEEEQKLAISIFEDFGMDAEIGG